MSRITARTLNIGYTELKCEACNIELNVYGQNKVAESIG